MRSGFIDELEAARADKGRFFKAIGTAIVKQMIRRMFFMKYFEFAGGSVVH